MCGFFTQRGPQVSKMHILLLFTWHLTHVVGGVLFSSLVATPSSLQSASICVKVSRQVLVCGGPAMRKSSR